MSEVKMTLAELLAVMDSARVDADDGFGYEAARQIEQARAAVSALVAERDSLLTVRETLKRECESLKAERDAFKAADESMQETVGQLHAELSEIKAENARLREAIASASDTFLEALAGDGHE